MGRPAGGICHDCHDCHDFNAKGPTRLVTSEALPCALLSVERFPPWRFIVRSCASLSHACSASTPPRTLTRRVQRATRPSMTTMHASVSWPFFGRPGRGCASVMLHQGARYDQSRSKRLTSDWSYRISPRCADLHVLCDTVKCNKKVTCKSAL